MVNSFIRKAFFFFFLFISFGFTSPNNTPLKKNSILDIVLDRGVLRVGVTADYIPFVFQDSKGNYKGIDIDLANQLANDMEVSLEFVPTTRKELTRDILLGKFDVAMSGLARTMKQALITNMSTGYFEGGKSLLESGHLTNVMTHVISPTIRYCFVRGLCLPEQKLSNAPYDVWVVLHKDTGNIVT